MLFSLHVSTLQSAKRPSRGRSCPLPPPRRPAHGAHPREQGRQSTCRTRNAEWGVCPFRATVWTRGGWRLWGRGGHSVVRGTCRRGTPVFWSPTPTERSPAWASKPGLPACYSKSGRT